jgi:adenosylhomocysteine nucleosidase
LAGSGRVAIVAALEREVWPLVRNWERSRRLFEGREFEFFEHDRLVLVCGGIGSDCARRATEAVIQLFDPELVISAGFAGALRSELNVGQVLTPRIVIDAGDSSRTDTQSGTGTLVTFTGVAGATQKAKLAQAFGAQAVDMEAAAVARGAEKHGVRFMACKAISDASDFSMPGLAHFVRADGKFQSGKFAFHLVMRPWLWKDAVKLARGSALASRKLCQSLAAFADMSTGDPIAVQAPSSVNT